MMIRLGGYYSITGVETTPAGIESTGEATVTLGAFFSFCRADSLGSTLSLLSLRVTDSLGLLRFILCKPGRTVI